MTARPDQPLEDADRFNDMWQAFADADARVVPPADLERRVLTAVMNRPRTLPVSAARALATWAASLAAVVAVSIAGAWWLTLPETVTPRPDPIATRAPDSPEPPRESTGALPAEAIVRARPAGRRIATPQAAMPAVLMTLDWEPVRDGEALQLIRLRLSRDALQTLGIVLAEPGTAGSVDVDVLIGEDGLPRDIRKVRVIEE